MSVNSPPCATVSASNVSAVSGVTMSGVGASASMYVSVMCGTNPCSLPSAKPASSRCSTSASRKVGNCGESKMAKIGWLSAPLRNRPKPLICPVSGPYALAKSATVASSASRSTAAASPRYASVTCSSSTGVGLPTPSTRAASAVATSGGSTKATITPSWARKIGGLVSPGTKKAPDG